MNNILKQLRESRGLTPGELAKVAGINVESYYDLEAEDEELDYGISVDGIARIAKKLEIDPSVLFGGTSTGTISTKDLARLIREHLRVSGKILAEFESEVGYGIAAALDEPEQFREFDADGLRAVCNSLGVNWFDLLDHLAAL